MFRIITFLLLFLPAVAQADEMDTLRFYNKELNQYTAAPGIASEIDIAVDGVTARTQVIQYFANNTDSWQEGVYSYPLPDDAAVDHLVMTIGGRRVLGFVAEKEKARKIYEAAKREGKAAALTEQHRANIFRTGVANIPPRSIVAIEIAYQHEVAVDGHDFSLRVPLAVTPRYDHFSPSEFLTLTSTDGDAARDVIERLALFDFSGGSNPAALRVTMQPGFALAKVESPSHEIASAESEDDALEITTKQKILPADRDFILRWSPRETDKPLAFLHQEETGGAVYSQLVVLPPARAEETPAPPRAVTLIIDVSGSMSGPSIAQAKAALIEALGDLEPDDAFNVISFQSFTEGWRGQPVPATEDNVKSALKWVAALEADGGTEMRPAVERALGETYNPELLRQIVFITDGAIGYESELGAYIRDHVGAARFFAVGIGAAPNAHLMRTIAMQGRGTFTFIGDVSETEETMKALFRKMKAPAVTDLALAFSGGGNVDVIPAKIPDLLAGEPVTLAIRSAQPLKNIAVTGRKGGKAWKHKVRAAARPAEGIGKIYARRKIADLKFSDPSGGPATAARILTLGIEHQLVTEQTSLVAVDEEILRPEGAPLISVRHDPSLPAGWQLASFDPREAAARYEEVMKEKTRNPETSPATRLDLPQTATGWQLGLLLSLLCFALAELLMRREKLHGAA